jgi:hypothetical protein
LIVIIGMSVYSSDRRENCTSAVLSMEATETGAPVLWKNRDTSVLSNKVVFVNEKPYRYLGLVNADSDSGRSCYAGLNSEGFGIMNTVGYNLPLKNGENKDLEGMIMADALRSCRTVSDFMAYLDANLGRDLGSQANFGVVDADGRAVLFEIHNHGYEMVDALKAPEKYIVNTNFARSGEPDKGAGYLRFQRATQLFRALPPGKIGFETILTNFTRDLGHVLLKQPGLTDVKKVPAHRDIWITTRDCIDKSYTSAAVIIIGKNPRVIKEAKKQPSTLWVIPGEPVCAIALPLWVEAGETPAAFWKGEEAPLWKESLRIRKIIRPFEKGNMRTYLNLSKLDNADGTGFLPKIKETEQLILKKTRQFLKKPRTPKELSEFQTQMAELALKTLKSIK